MIGEMILLFLGCATWLFGTMIAFAVPGLHPEILWVGGWLMCAAAQACQTLRKIQRQQPGA